MNSIEEEALSTYQANLNYFANEHPEVYKKVNLLNMAIESGQYKERYALEYKDGYFDIQELKTKQYLYGEDSNEVSKKVAKQVNFSKTDNVIESFYRMPLSKTTAQLLHNTKGVTGDILYATSNIIYYNNQYADRNTTLKRIEKYVFLGVGTGRHLELIQNRINASKILVIEDDIELFKLSLFTTNYNNVFKEKKVFYVISENEYNFRNIFANYFTVGYNHNQYLKYTIFSDYYLSKIKTIQNFIVTQTHISHHYSMQLAGLLKSPEYLVDGFRYLDVSKHAKSTSLTDKPTILIAAGPSLRKNIAWLKEHKDKFIIVSVLAAIKTLSENNIKADIVVNIDASQVVLKFLKDIDIQKEYSDTPFVFSPVVHKKLVNLFPKKNVYFFETLYPYKKDFGVLTSPSVGETTFALQLLFGFKEIYLLGLDLALDPETNSYYSDEKHEPKQMDEKKKSIYNAQLSDATMQARGNLLEIVKTTPLLNMSIFAFKSICENYKSDFQKVYNLNNGAYLEGAKPTRIEDIDISKFETIDKKTKKEVSLFLNNISEDYANDKDIENLSMMIDEAFRLYEIIQKQKKVKSYSGLDSYMNELAKLIHELTGKDKKPVLQINQLMYNYMLFIVPYIFDLFNTKELTNPKKHIKYINKTLLSQIEKMLGIYIKTLQVYKLFAEEKRDKSQCS